MSLEELDPTNSKRYSTRERKPVQRKETFDPFEIWEDDNDLEFLEGSLGSQGIFLFSTKRKMEEMEAEIVYGKGRDIVELLCFLSTRRF
jgi:hypothetical protein